MKALYARVSTEDQIKGYSIDNQIEECKRKAETTDILIYKDEGITGEILARPGLMKLREDIQSGLITELFCYDPDRLSRKLMHQLMLDEEFRKKGVFVKFVNGEYANTAEGQLFFQMRGAFAEFEKEKIKQRTVGGKIRKAKQGKVMGNYHLYGYDWDNEKETYKINEEQSEVVKLIFKRFLSGEGINGIAKSLTGKVPTARGADKWHRQVVRQILMNVSYTGKHPTLRYNTEGDYVRKQSGLPVQQRIRPEEEWQYAKIPAIISEEDFMMVSELIAQSKRRFAKEGLNQYLLSGLLRCKDCGNTMGGRSATWWGKQKKIYSDVKNTAGAKNKGCGNYIAVEELDEAIWNEISAIINNPDKIMEYKESNKESQHLEAELEHINTQMEKNKKGRQRLLKLVAMSDDIDLSDVREEIEELQKTEKSLLSQYKQIEKELKAIGRDNSDEMIKRAIEQKFKYNEWNFDTKREAIRALVKQIYVTKNEKEIEIHLF